MGCIFGCGIGQAISLCGNAGANFGACYSCHARERMRRKWNLPPAFCLPPGIDDCLVHFLCFYCASHQVGGAPLCMLCIYVCTLSPLSICISPPFLSLLLLRQFGLHG